MDIKLASLLLSYRATPHSTTKRTPSELFIGRRVRKRLDLLRHNLENSIQRKSSEKVCGNDNQRRVEVGDSVLVRDYRKIQEFWVKGVVIYKLGLVTYNV